MSDRIIGADFADGKLSVDAKFSDAIRAAANGEPQMLAELIRALPNVSNELLRLADFIEGEFARRPGNHSDPIYDSGYRRWALQRLRTVKTWWKRRNQPVSHAAALECVSKRLRMSQKELNAWYRNPTEYHADLPSGYKCYRIFASSGPPGKLVYKPIYAIIRPPKRLPRLR